MDQVHLGVAQLLLATGNTAAAANAAANGLLLLPKSASLYLIASEALRRQGKEYEARKLLQQGLSATHSEELLAHLAAMLDAHGEGAAALCRKLAESPQLPREKRLAAMRRGFEVALRDEDTGEARRLAELL